MVELNYIHAKRRNNLSLCTTHFKQIVNMFGFYGLWVYVAICECVMICRVFVIFLFCYCDLLNCYLLFVVICRFVMIYGFVKSLTWLILMVQAYASEISNARHQALGVSIVQSLVLYFVYWFFVS